MDAVSDSFVHKQLNTGQIDSVCQWLTQNPVDIAVTDHRGRTVFSRIVKKGNIDQVRRLFQSQEKICKACLLQSDKTLQTPLHIVAEKGDVEMIEFFLNKGAPIDAETCCGWRPLHFAARQGHMEAVKTLVERRAQVDCIKKAPNSSESPRRIAMNHGHVDVAIYLIQEGFKWQKKGLFPVKNPVMKSLVEANIFFRQKKLEQACRRYAEILSEDTLGEVTVFVQVYCLKKLGILHRTKAEANAAEKNEAAAAIRNYINAAKFFNSALMLYVKSTPVVLMKQVSVENLREQRNKTQESYCRCILGQQDVQNDTRDVRHMAFLKTTREIAKKVLTEGQKSPQSIAQCITWKIKKLTKALIKECFQVLGAPPCSKENYAIIGLGSMSRGEVNLYSDFEFGVLLRSDQDIQKCRAYFCKLTGLLQMKIIHFGETDFPVLRGGSSVTGTGYSLDSINPSAFVELINTQTGMLAAMQNDEKFDIIFRNLVKTVCFLQGDEKLVEEYQEAVRKHFHGSEKALQLLQADKQAYVPSLFEDKSEFIDIKRNLCRPFVELIHKVCLCYGIPGNTTWERLKGLKTNGVISQMGYDNLTNAFDTIFRLRLKAHAHYGTEKEEVFCLEHSLPRESEDEVLGTLPFVVQKEETQAIFDAYKTLIALYVALERIAEKKAIPTISPLESATLAGERLAVGDWISASTKAFHEKVAIIHEMNAEVLYAFGKILQKRESRSEALTFFKKALCLKNPNKVKLFEGIILTLMPEEGSTETLSEIIQAGFANATLCQCFELLQKAIEIVIEKTENNNLRANLVAVVAKFCKENPVEVKTMELLKAAFNATRRIGHDSVEANALHLFAFKALVVACDEILISVAEKVAILQTALEGIVEIKSAFFYKYTVELVKKVYEKLPTTSKAFIHLTFLRNAVEKAENGVRLEKRKEYYCPIMEILMTHPVSAGEGDVFDAEAIRIWERAGHMDWPWPIGKATLQQIQPDVALKNSIEEWKKKCREAIKPGFLQPGFHADWQKVQNDLEKANVNMREARNNCLSVQNEKYLTAITALESALAHTDSVKVYELYAAWLEEGGLFHKAGKAYAHLVEWYSKIQNRQKAKEAYDKVVALIPEDEDLHRELDRSIDTIARGMLEVINAIADESLKGLFSRVLEGFKFNAQETNLNLNGNGQVLGNVGMQVFGKLVETYSSIQVVEIVNIPITIEDGVMLADFIRRYLRVRVLLLNNNQLGDAEVIVIAKGLKENESLTKLDFSQNRIEAAGATAVVEAFMNNTHLKELILSDNQIKSFGVWLITKILQTNTNLIKISLKNNLIEDDGAQDLASVLSQIFSLQEVELDHNAIKDPGAFAIAKALKSNASLKKVSLSGNPIGRRGINELESACSRKQGFKLIVDKPLASM